MLQYLVRAKARRRLLSLLWGEGRRGSATELAEAAGVGFASAYRELHAMRRYDLARSEQEDGVEVFSANERHPLADVLRRLATDAGRVGPPRDEAAEELRGRLRGLGVPLTGPAVDVADEDVASTLVEGVKLARKDAVLARALPLGFWHQRDRLEGTAVAEAARRAGAKQAVGFYLDLTSELSGDPRFKAWSRDLGDRRVRTTQDFFELPPTSVSRGRRNDPKLGSARRWRYRMNMDLESFRSHFEKFSRAPA